MTKPDRNLYSYNGPEDNGIVVEARDASLPEQAQRERWSDTLKFTDQLQDARFTFNEVWGGDEDCADFNNKCSNIQLRTTFYPTGKYVATVKGGCTGIDIRGEIVGDTDSVDHEYGNYSEQSSAKTTGNVLGTWRYDGSPVTVRVLHADKPMLVPGTGPYRFLFPNPECWYHGIVVWCWMTWCRLSRRWR